MMQVEQLEPRTERRLEAVSIQERSDVGSGDQRTVGDVLRAESSPLQVA